MNFYELDEQTPYKKKKKKQPPKKSNHKHLYDVYVIKEEAPAYLAPFENKIVYNTYKKCTVCGRIDSSPLPQKMVDKVTEVFNKNPYQFKYWGFGLKNREEVEFLKENFPNEVEVIYLEK